MRNLGSRWTAIYNGTMLTLIQDKDQKYPFTNFQGKITLGTRALLSSVPISHPVLHFPTSLSLCLFQVGRQKGSCDSGCL